LGHPVYVVLSAGSRPIPNLGLSSLISAQWNDDAFCK